MSDCELVSLYGLDYWNVNVTRYLACLMLGISGEEVNVEFRLSLTNCYDWNNNRFVIYL